MLFRGGMWLEGHLLGIGGGLLSSGEKVISDAALIFRSVAL